MGLENKLNVNEKIKKLDGNINMLEIPTEYRILENIIPIEEKHTISVFNKYLDINKSTTEKISIGEGMYYNTNSSTDQLLFIIAQSKNPIITNIFTTDKKFRYDPKYIDLMFEQKILKELKILSLASGPTPYIEEIAVKMGAEVFIIH